MDHGDGCAVVLILQVVVEAAELSYKEHPLVDDGPGGEGGHVSVLAALLKLSSCDVETAVKVDALRAVLWPFHKALHDVGHALPGVVAQYLRVDRHISPAQKRKAALLQDDLKHFPGEVPLQRVLGKEEHAHAVVPLISQGNADLRGCLGKKRVGNLRQDSHSVTNLSSSVFACAVFQFFYDRKGVIQDLVLLDAVDTDNSSDAAGIVLKTALI